MCSEAATGGTSPRWRRALPLALAAVLLVIVALRIDRKRFLESVAQTNPAAFIVTAAAFTLTLLVTDCIASAFVYRRLVGDISIRHLVDLRAASYLPGLLNHNVGQAWLTYAIARTCRTSILRVAGATMLIYATTFACLTLLCAGSFVMVPGRFAWLPPILVVVTIAAALYVATLVIRPQWLLAFRLLEPLARTTFRTQALACLLRLPHVVVLFGGTLLPFWFFGVRIPITDALALIPPLMLIVALPITPQGVGTRDAFAVSAFAAYADDPARIAAAALCWAVALTLVQIPLSLVFASRKRVFHE